MDKIFASIDKKEWRFVALIIGALVAVTAIPYLIGFSITPAGYVYTGINFLTPGDINVYYSNIEQARSGQWLFSDLFTSETQAPHLFHPLWLLGGIIGSLFSISNPLVFQLLRILLIPFFILTVYLLIAYLNDNKRIRRLSLFFVSFSSGISVYFTPWFNKILYRSGGYLHFPMDLWVPESNTFLTLFHNPLFIFSLIFLILTFLFFLLAAERKMTKYSVYAGLACLFLILVHPFMVIVVLFVLVTYLFVHSVLINRIWWDGIKNFGILLLIASPSIVYYVRLLLTNEVFQRESSQNFNLTPAFWMIFFSYGFLLILFLVNLYANYRNKEAKYVFVLTWFLVQLALLWSPIYFQRRLSEGLHIPLAYLAVLGLWFLYENIKKIKGKKIWGQLIDYRAIWAFSFIILLGFSNVLVYAESIKNYITRDRNYIYQPKSAIAVYDWLKSNINTDKIILAEPPMHNFIPGYAGRTVYWGHEVATVNYDKKRETVLWFYEGMIDPAKTDFLNREKIDYVIFQKKPIFLNNSPGFNLAYSNQNYWIYHFTGQW